MDLSLGSRLEEWDSPTVSHPTSAIPVPCWRHDVEKWTSFCSPGPASAFKAPRNRNLFPRAPSWSAAPTSQGVQGTACICQNLLPMSLFVSFYLVVPSLPVAPTEAPPAPLPSPSPPSNPSIISSPRPFTAIPVPRWHVEKRTSLDSPTSASLQGAKERKSIS